MKKKVDDLILFDQQTGVKEKINLPGYPLYPASEDIYENGIKEEKLPDQEPPNREDETERPLEINFHDIISGSDIDVPGSELDDSQEITGSEDEENNYYSIGGENHDDLEENREG